MEIKSFLLIVYYLLLQVPGLNNPISNQVEPLPEMNVTNIDIQEKNENIILKPYTITPSIEPKHDFADIAYTVHNPQTGLTTVSFNSNKTDKMRLGIGEGDGKSWIYEDECHVNKGNNNVTFGPVYLPKGEYILGVVYETDVVWISFQVNE